MQKLYHLRQRYRLDSSWRQNPPLNQSSLEQWRSLAKTGLIEPKIIAHTPHRHEGKVYIDNTLSRLGQNHGPNTQNVKKRKSGKNPRLCENVLQTSRVAEKHPELGRIMGRTPKTRKVVIRENIHDFAKTCSGLAAWLKTTQNWAESWSERPKREKS